MTFRRSATLIAAAALAAALAGCAQQGPAAGSAAAATTQPAPAAAAQVLRQASAKGLYELAYSARQNAVFVASSGGFGADADKPKVLRLDPQTLAVRGEIPLERKAFGVALDDAGGRLYIGNTVDLSVTVVDIVANRVVGTVQLEEKATTKDKDGKDVQRYARDLRELVVDPASKRLFLQGHGGDNGSVLYVVDTQTLKVVKTLPGLGNTKAPGLAFDAAGQRLFVTNLLGELITIDTRTVEITKRVKTSAEQPLNLAYDPATRRIFATDQGAEAIRKYQGNSIPGFVSKNAGNRVVVFDADSGRELASIPTGAGPLGVLLDGQRKRLLVTNRAAGTLSVYDSTSYALQQTVNLPTHPNSLAFDAQRNVAYVSIKNGEKDPKGAAESVARVAF